MIKDLERYIPTIQERIDYLIYQCKDKVVKIVEKKSATIVYEIDTK